MKARPDQAVQTQSGSAQSHSAQPIPVQTIQTQHTHLLEELAGYASNALLLTGPARVGKLALARAIAAAQNCTGTRGIYGEGCGHCPSCLAFLAGAHPDLLLVEPRATTTTGKAARRKIIPVGAVLASRDKAREFENHIFEFLEIRPTFARRTVIVQGAEYLGPEAANAMLKVVEEPPHHALFLFLAEDARSVLPTIASRSARVLVPPLETAALAGALGTLPQSHPDLLEFAAGRAGVLSAAEVVGQALTEAQQFHEALSQGLLPALEAAQTLEKGWQADWHPEALRFVWRDLPPATRARADQVLSDLQGALEAYANPSLSFQVLALRLREVMGEN